MKAIKLSLLIFGLSAFSLCLHAQSMEVPSAVISALNNSNPTQLSSYFNSNVEIVVGSQNDIFSSQQANAILTDFFRKNHVMSFQLLHKGTKEAACFAIGMLKTSNGGYRVYILMRKNLIQQLRIELSND
jgi:Domain of unknown function (DUF4783)